MVQTAHLGAMDYLTPAIFAFVFVILMSQVKEPVRLILNAVLVAGSCSAYLNGGFGVWELLYPVIATPIVYLAFRSYRYIGIAWLMHAAWDLPHHLWGNPILPFMRSSSLGCAIFDASIAIWFLTGAHPIFGVAGRTAYREDKSIMLENVAQKTDVVAGTVPGDPDMSLPG